MKHFVVEITYRVPFEQLEPFVLPHRAFLASGYDRGWLLCSGPQVPRRGGIVVARAPSEASLRQFFADDPYAHQGLADHRIIEFEPVLHQALLEEWTMRDPD